LRNSLILGTVCSFKPYKMKICYLSDLHLELVKPSKMDGLLERIPCGDICVLAGDIGNPYQPNYDIFMLFIRLNFRKTFVIAGNHEYYYHTIEETNEFLTRYFQRFENITFLKDSYEIYEGYCFAGTTLWSNITNPKFKINDMYSIHEFDYVKYNQLHRESVAFLEDVIEKNEKCIVITHHLPSYELIDAKYLVPAMRPYNQWFYSHMDHLFHPDKIKAWFYGHTHTPCKKVIQDIPFLCNPIGYPGENEKVDFEAVFEL